MRSYQGPTGAGAFFLSGGPRGPSGPPKGAFGGPQGPLGALEGPRGPSGASRGQGTTQQNAVLFFAAKNGRFFVLFCFGAPTQAYTCATTARRRQPAAASVCGARAGAPAAARAFYRLSQWPVRHGIGTS